MGDGDKISIVPKRKWKSMTEMHVITCVVSDRFTMWQLSIVDMSLAHALACF